MALSAITQKKSEKPFASLSWLKLHIGDLALIFNEPISPERVEAYAEALATSGVEPKHLAEAFVRARNELKFFPKPAELLALAYRDEETLDHVWRALMDYCDKYNTTSADYRPELPKLVRAALAQVGSDAEDGLNAMFNVLASADGGGRATEHLLRLRREFLAAYQRCLQKERTERALAAAKNELQLVDANRLQLSHGNEE